MFTGTCPTCGHDHAFMQRGAFYQARHGRIVGPLTAQPRAAYPWIIIDEFSYRSDGRIHDGAESPHDLVEKIREG